MKDAQKLSLAFVSLILSLLLYLQVQAMSDQSRERSFKVKARLDGLPNGLTPVASLPEVEVIARGKESSLNRLNSDDWFAVIDMSQATVGRSRYPVRVTGPASAGYAVQPASRLITLEIAKLGQIDARVRIQERGRLSPDLRYGQSKCEPAIVLLRGPEPALEQVKEVRVLLDLSRLKPGDTPTNRVEVIGRDGLPLVNVQADPDTVTIRPSLVAPPPSATVIITPRWKGQPAFSYEIESVEVEPNSIDITGNGRVLASVGKIYTEAIDISGLKENREFKVNLQFPAGVNPSRAPERTVRVRLRLNRVEPTEASPPASPTAAP